jgi:hypothetical protein
LLILNDLSAVNASNCERQASASTDISDSDPALSGSAIATPA